MGRATKRLSGAAAAATGDFSMSALVVARAGFAACLALADEVDDRFGV